MFIAICPQIFFCLAKLGIPILINAVVSAIGRYTQQVTVLIHLHAEQYMQTFPHVDATLTENKNFFLGICCKKSTGKMKTQKTGKVRKFSQSEKVGTMWKNLESLFQINIVGIFVRVLICSNMCYLGSGVTFINVRITIT